MIHTSEGDRLIGCIHDGEPSYYMVGTGDLIDAMESGLLDANEVRGFLKGNIYKYLTRYPHKDGIKDLQKAKTYLIRLIEYEQHLKEIGCGIPDRKDSQ